MSIKRPLSLSMALCLGLFLISLDCYGDQTSDASATSDAPAATQSKAGSTDSSGEPKTTAKIVADQPIFEFEPVLEGETVTHTFVLKNSGTAELKILKVRTG